MKIYIAGPMTGFPDYNRAEFNKAADYFNDFAIALNPAVLPSGLEQSEYMDICCAMIRACDGIFILNGYEDSLGALAEIALAKKLGLKVIYQQAISKQLKVGESMPLADHPFRDEILAKIESGELVFS